MATASRDPNWALRNAVLALAGMPTDRIGVVRRRPARRGNCYVACEVFYHLLGGKAAGLTPMVTRMPDGETHWFLRQEIAGNPNDPAGWQTYRIIAPSRGQFTKKEQKGLFEIYAEGRGTGFLTKAPSKRARKLIELLTWQGGLR